MARSAGVSRSAFYFYFPSKHAAVAELLESLYRALAEVGQELMRGPGTPQENLTTALAHTLASWRRHRLLLCAMLDAVAVDREMQDVWDGWMQLFEDFLVQAAEDQVWPVVLPPGVELRAAIKALHALNLGVLERHVRANGNAAAAADALALMNHVWLRTLFGSEPT